MRIIVVVLKYAPKANKPCTVVFHENFNARVDDETCYVIENTPRIYSDIPEYMHVFVRIKLVSAMFRLRLLHKRELN